MEERYQIQERNMFIFVFLVPIVFVVTICVEYGMGIAALLSALDSYSYGYGYYGGMTGGTLALIIICSIIQLASIVYWVIIWTGLSKDINIMCENDEQSPLMSFWIAYLIGALVPFGFIYYIYYIWKIHDKLERYSYRYNAGITTSSVAIVLFAILINIVALALIVNDFNKLARAYNAQAGYYSEGSQGISNFSDFAGQVKGSIEYANNKDGLLRCVSGEAAGTSIVMKNGDTIVLGRDPQISNVILREDKNISRRHCSISYRNGTFYIVDYSSNGTRLANGSRLQTNVETSLGNHASIKLSANTEFTVQIKPN